MLDLPQNRALNDGCGLREGAAARHSLKQRPDGPLAIGAGGGASRLRRTGWMWGWRGTIQAVRRRLRWDDREVYWLTNSAANSVGNFVGNTSFLSDKIQKID